MKKTIYATDDQTLEIRKQIINEQEKLKSKLHLVEQKYIDVSKKKQLKKSKHVSKVFKLSKKMRKLQVTIQRNEVALIKLEEGKYRILSTWQKFKAIFSNMSYKTQKRFFGILFILPWLIGFCIFFLVPLVTTIWWSFNDMSLKQGGGFNFEFIKFGNYKAIFSTATLGGLTVMEILTSSVINILINLPVILIFSLFIAVLLNSKFNGHQIVRAIFFIPVVFNMTAINNTLTGTFGQLFSGDLDNRITLSEQFSMFLMQMGIGQSLIEFLINAVDRIFTIVNMSGIQILIFLAALQSIPKHLYEAAEVEGATKYEMFWKITIPMVSPIILTVVVYTVVDSFATSEIMRYMTVFSQGTTMATHQPGLYSAISILYFLVNALIIGLFFLMMRRVVFYHDK